MPVPHCMFSAGRCVFWCALAGGESDFCGRNGRWKGLIFRHNRVFIQNQGAVLKKSSLRGMHPGDFPSRQGENERRPISCAHSRWIKRSTLLCRKMTRVHPVVSFPLKLTLEMFCFDLKISARWGSFCIVAKYSRFEPKTVQSVTYLGQVISAQEVAPFDKLRFVLEALNFCQAFRARFCRRNCPL